MGEFYVEFKPCYKTLYTTVSGIDKTIILPNDCNFKAHFVNKKCDSIYWNITNDLRFIYGYYQGRRTYFKVTNISSKPILNKCNKVEKWHKITQEINKLKKQRKNLLEN